MDIVPKAMARDQAAPAKCYSCGEGGEGGREGKNSTPDIQKRRFNTGRVRLRLTLGKSSVAVTVVSPSPLASSYSVLSPLNARSRISAGSPRWSVRKSLSKSNK